MTRAARVIAVAVTVLLGMACGAMAQATKPAAGAAPPPKTTTPPVAGGAAKTTPPPPAGANAAQAAAAAPAPGTGPVTTQAPWASGCLSEGRNSALECQVEGRVLIAQTGQTIATVRVQVPADTRKPVMQVQMPLQVYLPAGATVDVDGNNPQKAELQYCDASGCFGALNVSSEVLAAMFNGDKLNIKFEGMGKQLITVTMALTGFRAAFTKIN